MKIRGVMALQVRHAGVVNKMQQEVFDALARSEEPGGSEKDRAEAQQVYRRYLDELDGADVKELAIHRRVSKRNYYRRCGWGRLCRQILNRMPRDLGM